MELTGLESIIFILAIISALYLIYKGIALKDVSIFGAAITRVYLAFIMGFEMYSGFISPILVRVAIVLILLGESIIGTLHYFNSRKRKNTYVDIIDSLRYKLYAAIDSSLVPFFTIDQNGIIEYLNDEFAKLFGENKVSLIGKDLSVLLNIDKTRITKELVDAGVINCHIKTYLGEREAVVIGKATSNGHDTITGSIYLN